MLMSQNRRREDADMKVLSEKSEGIFTVTINRPERRNAVNRETADLLVEALKKKPKI